MGRLAGKFLGGALCLVMLAVAAPATAQAPLQPYDGHNPFRCKLQQAGTGTDFPNPAADPFCVEYDKTHQNISELGLVDFLLQEPARIAAATDKCFYFQHDHWTGWVEEGSDPELWHWDGSYMIDMARGAIAGHLENFRVNGEPASPADYFTIPPSLAPFFGSAEGGALLYGLPPQPRCLQRVDTRREQKQVYVDPARDAPPLGAGPLGSLGGLLNGL
jgi:hypothetical protein